MDPGEYAARFRDVPDSVLDSDPSGDVPEQIRTAWQLADAERMPDPLSDPPGPGLAAGLAEQAGGELGDAGLIERITGLDRQASRVAAGQLRAIAELAKRRVACWGSGELGFVVDELALALTCSRYSAWARLQTALDLVDRLPATLAALSSGRICAARARVIAEGTRALTDDDAALVQDEVLPLAEALTPAKLRSRVAAAAAAVDPRGADEGHEDACAQRTVAKYPREHGMTGIWALLPADHAAAVWAAVTTHAETTRQPDDGRTAEQRRSESLTELMSAYLDGTCPADLPGAGTLATHQPADTAVPSDSTAAGTTKPTETENAPSGATESAAPAAVGSPGHLPARPHQRREPARPLPPRPPAETTPTLGSPRPPRRPHRLDHPGR